MQKKKRLPGRAGACGSRRCKSRSRPSKRGLHSLRTRLFPSSLNELAAREYGARRGATRAPKPTPHTCAACAAAAPCKIYGMPLLWFSGVLAVSHM
eukprot:2394369-Prymnesium_polylepis.1